MEAGTKVESRYIHATFWSSSNLGHFVKLWWFYRANDQKDDIFKDIAAIRILLKCTEYNEQLW